MFTNRRVTSSITPHHTSEDIRVLIRKTASYFESDFDLFPEYNSQWIIKLRKFFLVSETNIRTQFIFRSRTSIRNERKRQIENYPWFIIHPFSNFRTYWETYMLIIFLLSMLILPFYSGYLSSFHAGYRLHQKKPYGDILLGSYLVFVLDILCLIDIFTNFLTGYHSPKQPEVVLAPVKIAKRYLLTYFFPDFFSSVPIDFFYAVVGGIEDYANMPHELSIVLHIFRLLKLFRIITTFTYYYRTCEKRMISYFFYKLIAVMVLFFYLIHWMNCISLIIPEMVHYDKIYKHNIRQSNSSWIKTRGIYKMDLWTQYVYSTFKTLKNLVGLGFTMEGLNNIEDQIVVLIVGIAGRIHWLYFLVVFVQVMKTKYAARTKYAEIMDQLKAYMEYRKLSPDLKRKLVTFYTYRYQNYYLKEDAITNSMSDNLIKEISMHTCRKLIERVEMFKNLPSNLIAGIVSSLKSEVFLPNDVIVRVGTLGDCMYFVLTGTMAVFTAGGNEICHLHDGDYFGEVALFLEESKRTATVIAVELSELYRLDSNDFTNVIMPHQEIYFRIEKLATDRYQETLKLSDGNFDGKVRRRRRRKSEQSKSDN